MRHTHTAHTLTKYESLHLCMVAHICIYIYTHIYDTHTHNTHTPTKYKILHWCVVAHIYIYIYTHICMTHTHTQHTHTNKVRGPALVRGDTCMYIHIHI